MKKILIIFALLVSLSKCSNLYYCADFSCQEPISIGKTLLRYSGKTEKHLSFSQNEEIRILSKPDFDGDDWVAYCRGKVGLVPKSMVREMKMIKYDTKLRFPFDNLPLWASDPGIKETTDESNYIDNPATASEQPSSTSTPPVLEISPGTSYEQNETDFTSEKLSQMTPELDLANGKDIVENSLPKQESPENAKDSPQTQKQSENNATKDEVEPSVTVEYEHVPPPVGIISIPENVASESLEPQANDNSEDIESTEASSKFDTVKEITSSVINNILPEDLQDDTVTETKDTDQAEPTPLATLSEVEHLPTPEALIQNLPTDNSEAGPAETAAKLEPKDKFTEAKIETGKVAPEINSLELQEISVNANVPEVKDSAFVVKLAEGLLANKEEQVRDSSNDSDEVSDDSLANLESRSETGDNIEVLEKKIPEVPQQPIPEILEQTDIENHGYREPKVSEPNKLPVVAEVPETKPPEPKNPDISETKVPEPEVLEIPEREGAEVLDSEVSEVLDSEVSEVLDSEVSEVLESEVPEVSESEVPEVSESEVPQLPEPETSEVSEPENPDSHVPEVTKPAVAEVSEGVSEDSSKNIVPEAPVLQVPSVLELIPGLPQDSHEESEQPESQTVDSTLTVEPSAQVTPVADVQRATEYSVDSSASMLSQVSSLPQVAEDLDPELPQVSVPEIGPQDVGQDNEAPEHSLDHQGHSHGHSHNHGHSHSHERFTTESSSPWSIIVVMKHLSGTLLNLLPEHLQDTILDVDSALVFTGIIALMLVSICVPYFVLESILAVRPLKKQVVELNKSLWKVSAAYENQQEEFDMYKKKALAYDEDQKRIETLEMELQILKKLEGKQKDQVRLLQKQLKTSAKAADKIEDLIDASIRDKELALEENNLLKSNYAKLQATLKSKLEELEEAQAQGSALALDLEVVQHERENLSKRLDSLDNELELTKLKLFSENENRKAKEGDNENLVKEKEQLSTEMIELRRILHQYEENVGSLTDELTGKENELLALKESLGEDSPLIDISEVKAKLKSAEEEAASLKSRVESINFENSRLSRTLEEIKSELATVLCKKEEAENNLKVLEGWFHKKEEELRAAVAKLEVEQSVKHKNKDDLIKMIREKESEIQILISTNEGLKQEIEDMKGAHRNEIRTAEAKADEHWLSLCQSERKTAEARKECEQLRQKLVALVKEKDGEDNDLLAGLGDVPLYSLPPEMVPPPVPDDLPIVSYFPLDDDFIPPVPLPLGTEPMRPPPLGRLSPTSPHNNYSYLDEDQLSPIVRNNGGRGDYSGDSSRSDSPDHRRPGSRDNWMNDNRSDRQSQSSRRRRGHPHGNGPKTSSPIPHGVNL